MWMEKLAGGVLRVSTPLGPRYIAPSLRQRIFLLWIFRNFQTLPMQVLAGWQRRLVESMCTEHRFVAIADLQDTPVIGTVERRPPVEVETPVRRPSASVGESVPSMVAENRQSS